MNLWSISGSREGNSVFSNAPIALVDASVFYCVIFSRIVGLEMMRQAAQLLRHAAAPQAASMLSPSTSNIGCAFPLAARGVAGSSGTSSSASSPAPTSSAAASAPSQVRGNNAEFVVSKLDTVVSCHTTQGSLGRLARQGVRAFPLDFCVAPGEVHTGVALYIGLSKRHFSALGKGYLSSMYGRIKRMIGQHLT